MKTISSCFLTFWSESVSEDNVNWGGGAGSSEYKAGLAQLGLKPGLGMCEEISKPQPPVTFLHELGKLHMSSKLKGYVSLNWMQLVALKRARWVVC